MKKREMVAQLFQQHRHLFRCPVCQNAVWMQAGNLVCAQRHTFDLSKRGYLNLLRRPARTRYDADMFTSRRALCQSGFFNPILATVSQVLQQKVSGTGQTSQTILDAGCGEGSHLTDLVACLQQAGSHAVQGVGIDISKDGIRLAARDAWHILWCVADLSQLPIANQQIDGIINILSPANYAEFGRVLTENGTVIKVAPGEHYLAELRANLLGEKPGSDDSHARVIQQFAKYFRNIEVEHLTYTTPVVHEQLESLINMTPLSWNVSLQKRQQMQSLQSIEVTVDVSILVGKKVDMFPVGIASPRNSATRC